MKTISIDTSKLPKTFGPYQYRCIFRGHKPGVLSGAELRGVARHYGARYSESRANVAAYLSKNYDVIDHICWVIEHHRYCRVWMCQTTGERVQFK